MHATSVLYAASVHRLPLVLPTRPAVCAFKTGSCLLPSITSSPGIVQDQCAVVFYLLSFVLLQVEPRLLRRLAACIRQLMTAGLLPENDLEEARTLKEELKEVVADPYSALTDEEREEIVRAVKLPTGSWYACPKGQLSSSCLGPLLLSVLRWL